MLYYVLHPTYLFAICSHKLAILKFMFLENWKTLFLMLQVHCA